MGGGEGQPHHPGGNFLRRARIDELPQLLNILRGEMSFVGPRPERPMFVKELAEKIPFYNERHMVKAGLTGWAQINYPYGASIDDARSKLSYDLYYVKNFSDSVRSGHPAADAAGGALAERRAVDNVLIA